MAQFLVDDRVTGPDLERAAAHLQRPARQHFANEADMLIDGGNRRGRARPERVRHARCVAKRDQAFQLFLDIDAHIHVPHLVAVPLVAAALPEGDHGGQFRQVPRTSTTARAMRKPAPLVSDFSASLVAVACNSSAPLQVSQMRKTAEWL